MIVDLFGGPGGWAEGLRLLGLSEVGIELDPWACATRRAAGHPVIRADVATYPLDHLAGRVEGLIASPPCQTFSTAGNGEGRGLLHQLCAYVDDGDYTSICHCCHPSGARYVLELGRWAEAIRPRWVVAEQVPPVLPLWHAYARRLRTLGYSAWAGVLNAANYGVPQTRQRAILVASLDRTATPPAGTHSRGIGNYTLFGPLHPWVSMAEALGWGLPAEPAPVVMTARNRQTGCDVLRGSSWRAEWFRRQQEDGNWVLRQRQRNYGDIVRPLAEPSPTLALGHDAASWVWERPATTLTGDERCFGPHSGSAGEPQSSNSVRLTLTEALTLQSFRPDYPVQGTKTKQFEQVGNAVPPLLAAHIIAAVTGRTIEAAA